MSSDAAFDLVVIGAGAAGSTIAAEAKAMGANVALIEQWKVGGTCLNAGCDPTKTLVRSAEVLHLAQTAARYGIVVDGARADWPAIRDRVETVIDTIRGGDGDANIRRNGVALYKGHARFRSPHEIDVDGERLHTDRAVIASGARVVVPPIPGLVETGFITNLEAVALPRLPR
ncbi:MAG TPA: FAD-dependent oxidoreductase, partial [Thermomicrobiales bacterium]|nr:FAD-dependent oxidoreductase [Thermomicrobiales bacterium]